MTRQLPIIVEQCEEGGFFAECPLLPGCHVQGETYEETLKEIQAAVEAMIDDYIASGDPLPVGAPILTTVTVKR
jgi:predicted RNase H-like HicB family nuclease